MSDEQDLSPERKWLYEERAKIAVANLNRRNINAQFVSSREEALPVIMEMIHEGATVMCGDSVSLEQVGVLPELMKRNKNKVIAPFARDASGRLLVAGQKQMKMFREAFTADVFLTGMNAVTLDGKLVSTDAIGNRVAAMIFGPEKVIVVAGANKLVKDMNEAIERIHAIAAPINARRHFLKHHVEEFGDLACVRTGKCVDCTNDWRICCSTVIIEGTYARVKGRMNVVLVGEELGI
jgi:hypothetical protein